ncbi:transaldolase [Microbulbifer hydrolyticus]|uniref:Transaldolase n=1 Tax=Microbulbifer hydrolyticus TaxID=48074 RepID=A0A6P1TEA0_9GAMM|nr:transaldolase [Microbulbifer hydrolyticus]MBB5212326.1 transaldolase [Microbulbifer hydrolyticus]QHQ39973.1 transaldolase [Microbulbifer hydrolyticus]
MNKLDQLKKRSLVVADTGDIEAIRRYQPEDATTNPSLLYKAAQLPQYEQHLKDSLAWAEQKGGGGISLASMKLAVAIGHEILQIVPGVVSTEVDARLSFDTAASIDYARQLIALYEQAGIGRERVLIKLASTWEGISAASVLEHEGIHCNLTLLFSESQAIACAEAGVTLISPFVGRILDWYKASTGRDDYTANDDPGVLSVTSIYEYYKSREYPTIVMGASFRNTGEIEALAGCDKLTISPQLLQELQDDTGTLADGLSSDIASQERPASTMQEPEFRYQLNADAMATEKLAEGIRNFVADQLKLEALLQQSR